MINELVNLIGKDKMNHELDNIKVKNTIYIKLNKVNQKITENDFLIIENDILPKDLNKYRWYQERERYISVFNSNKSYVKGILSCQELCYSFNIKTIIGKVTKNKNTDIIIKNKNSIIEVVKNINIDFLEKLNSDTYLEVYQSNLNNIFEYVFKLDEEGKFKISDLLGKKVKIFIGADLEEFKKKYEKYKEEKWCNEKGEEIWSPFITRDNKKKPLLSVSHLDKEKAADFFIPNKDEWENLNLFQLYFEKCTNINDKKIDIMYFKNKNNLGQTKINISKSKEGIIIHDYKDIPIDLNSDQFDIFKCKPMIIKDNLAFSDYEKEINSNKAFCDYFNYLLNNQFYIKSTFSNFNKLDNNIKSFINQFQDTILNLNRYNQKKFMGSWNRIYNLLFKIYQRKDPTMLKIIINFNISIENYFFNKKEDIKGMYDLIKEKMEDTKKYKIESDEEFLYLCGLSARYLRNLSKAKEKTDRLLTPYLINSNIRSILNLLKTDVIRFKYKIPFNAKFNDVYSKILNYDSLNVSIKENNKFLCGLFGDISVFYNKKSENNTKMEEK